MKNKKMNKKNELLVIDTSGKIMPTHRKLSKKRVAATLAAIGIGATGINILDTNSRNLKYQNEIDKQIESENADGITLDIYTNELLSDNISDTVEEKHENEVIPNYVKGDEKEEWKNEFFEFCEICLEYNKLVNSNDINKSESSYVYNLQIAIKNYADSGKLLDISKRMLESKMKLAIENGKYSIDEESIHDVYLGKEPETGKKVLYVSNKPHNLNDIEQTDLPESVFIIANDILEFSNPKTTNIDEMNANVRNYATMGEHLVTFLKSNYVLDEEGKIKRVNDKDYYGKYYKAYPAKEEYDNDLER